MRIYLGNALLMASQEFNNIASEIEKRHSHDNSWERDRLIYLWNSKRFVTSRDDEAKINKDKAIFVSLKDYNTRGLFDHEFYQVPIEAPDQFIHITGYSSSLRHSLKSVMEAVRRLEAFGIDCLVNNTAAPLLSHVVYASERVRKAIKEQCKVQPVLL